MATLTKAQRTYFLVNSLVTEIGDGAKVSQQVAKLVAALAKEQGVQVNADR